MNAVEEMLQAAFDQGEESAQRAYDSNTPSNYVLQLNPYKGFGRNSSEAWSNGFHCRMNKLSESN